MRTVLRVAVLGLLMGACSKKPVEGALRVNVEVGAGAKVDCVAVAAAPAAGGPEKLTALVPRAGANHFVFGVVSGDGLSGDTRVVARGFVGPCDSTALLNVESASEVHNLTPGVVRELTLRLEAAAFDDDHDGYRRSDAGGPDCFDEDAGTRPGVAEVCADGLDNNCDRHTDCEDPVCDSTPCDDHLACTVMDHCQLGACQGMTLSCDQAPATGCYRVMGHCDGDGGCLYDPLSTGSTCDGGVCRNDGVCVPANTEFDCTNGVDDDGDGLTDCLDPDCFTTAVACDDHLACTQSDHCVADGGCTGAPRLCQNPGFQCGADAGSCVEPGGTCVYPVATGKSCAGSDPCMDNELCLADGGCEGTPKTCSQSTDPCRAASGTCAPGDGGCVFAVNAGATCDDLDDCTATDLCQSTGQCLGSAYTCQAPPNGYCYPGMGRCEGDGGCVYLANAGLSCLGTGTCLSDGTCDQPDAGSDGGPADAGSPDSGVADAGASDAGNGFPYVPSNFNPAAITTAQIAPTLTINCGTATINTTNGTFTVCGGAAPTVVMTTQTTGQAVALVAVRGLVITATGVLTVTGNKPLIIASFGDLDVQLGGQLLSNSKRVQTGTGPGANVGCATAQSGANGVVSGGHSGGGGGAGLGAAGSNGGASSYGEAGGAAGVADGNAELLPLKGGCRGGNGLNSEGGNGGGAVQLSSTTLVRVAGVISTSGAGGTGALANNGNAGAGGGSGGGILLEGMTLSVLASARLTANGGGGGEGSGGNASPGSPGGDGSTNSTTAATRGTGGSISGGDGATGATSTSPPGTAGTGDGATGGGGGGGGGGGLGRIRLNARGGAGSCSLDGSAVLSATVSKPAPCP